ncbi:MAG: hypothetical protein ACREL1_09515 [bacterium]
MKNQLTAVGLFVLSAVGILIWVGCQPKALTQGTVEVYYSNDAGAYSNGCTVIANVDGNDTVTVLVGDTPWTFPDTVSPGNHNMNFTTLTGDTCDGGACQFQNNSLKYTLNFNVNGGQVFEATILGANPACNVMTVTGSS